MRSKRKLDKPTPKPIAKEKTGYHRLPVQLLLEIRKYLTSKQSVMMEFACKKYWTSVRAIGESGLFYFGSEEEYIGCHDFMEEKEMKKYDKIVKKKCLKLRKYPEKMKCLHSIYVSYGVFMNHPFNPIKFPSLKRVYLEPVAYDLCSEYHLLVDDCLQDMISRSEDEEDAFKLEILNAGNQMTGTLEEYMFRKDFGESTFFFLDHRDWYHDGNAYAFWEQMLECAVERLQVRFHNNPFELKALKSFRKDRDPFALEAAFRADEYDDEELTKAVEEMMLIFHDNVNPWLYDAFHAVMQGDLEYIKQWLSSDESTHLASRVLAFTLDFKAEYLSDIPGIQDITLMLIESGKIDFNYKGRRNRPLLLTAALNHRWTEFKIILSNGAKIDSCLQDEETVLMIAAKGGFLSIVEFLWELEEPVDVSGYSAVNALVAAARHVHLDVVKFFLEFGVPVDLEQIIGYGRFFANDLKRMPVIRYLIEQFENLDELKKIGDQDRLHVDIKEMIQKRIVALTQ